MTVRTTSIEAYKRLKEEGKDITNEEKVYLAIKIQPNMTDSEIAMVLGFDDRNQVRPRRKSLLDQGLIHSTGTRSCLMTGRECLTWAIVENVIKWTQKTISQSKR